MSTHVAATSDDATKNGFVQTESKFQFDPGSIQPNFFDCTVIQIKSTFNEQLNNQVLESSLESSSSV